MSRTRRRALRSDAVPPLSGVFAANVEGARQAFAFLKSGMEQIDRELTQRIEARFDDMKSRLDAFRDPAEPGGYKLYTAELRAKNAAELSRRIQALQEPLSKIAGKVATAQ